MFACKVLKAIAPQRKKKENDKTPLFELKPSLLDESSRTALSDFASEGLGPDPSSKHFMLRKKSIVYVMLVDGEVCCLQRNTLHQAKKYNDFQGGYVREYNILPERLVQEHLTKTIKKFARMYNLPNYATILLQLQQSVTPPRSSLELSKNKKRATDITGQGIHTDGHDRAAIVCIDRVNVNGAENALYADLKGKEELFPITTLEEGDALFFKDNQLYHYVSNATPVDKEEELKRTVLLMHYPALHSLKGVENDENMLEALSTELKLRNHASQRNIAVNGLDQTEISD